MTKLGDMRTYGGTNTPAKQRARNTGLSSLPAASFSALPPPPPPPLHSMLLHQNVSNPASAFGQSYPYQQVPMTCPTPNALFGSAATNLPEPARKETEPTPDYISEPRDMCDDIVAFGGEDEEQARYLLQVSNDLSEREIMTTKRAQRWSDGGKSTEEVVKGSKKMKSTTLKMIGNKSTQG
jgi:hypothetical protein